jgi:serine/threonine protein kinase
MRIESEPKRCPRCSGPIAAEAPQGLCPKCLLLQASLSTEAGTSASPKPAPPAPEELAVAFPQLEILELIGQGGMGFVFKARQPKLDRVVALKILPQSLAADPAFAERFTREGRVLARLNHPNIVTIHDFGQANGFFYLLMEFVDGVNLRQAMKVGRFTPAQALAIVPKICEALQFAHNEGILHRDIKPENILLDTKGRVKIADFGIAKLVGDAGRAGSPLPAARALIDDGAHGVTRPTALTETGKVLGTPQYMAPEQLEHPQDVDQRADIYSLGVVFYEMLTGELPIGRFAPPSEKSGADPRVDEVVLRTLEKERERRQHSAGEVKTQVETIATTPNSHSSRREEAPMAFAKPNAEWGKRMPLLSPLQSLEVRDICAHLTKSESNRVSLLGLLFGVWIIAAAFGIPFLIQSSPSPGSWIVGAVFGIIFFVTLPMLSGIGRQFLCSTTWAKAQGFTPEHLNLFSFRGSNLWKGLGVLLVLLSLVFAQHKAVTAYLGLSALPNPNPVLERQQNGAAKSRVPTQAQPGKMVVLTGATNELLNATNNLRLVRVHTDSTLLPGETLVALSTLPDGRTVEDGSTSFFIHRRTTSVQTSSHFSWSLADSFSPDDFESAATQIRQNTTGRPIELPHGKPVELFSVTNKFGGIVRGFLRFERFVPGAARGSAGAGTDAQATVRLRSYGGGLLAFYTASVPPGYFLEAADNSSGLGEGEAWTSINNGSAGCHSSWSPPQSFTYEQKREAVAQLQQLAKEGPLRVVYGEPRQVFSITNNGGEVYRGFFELVGPPVPAELPGYLPPTDKSSATVPGLAPPEQEGKFVIENWQVNRANPEPPPIRMVPNETDMTNYIAGTGLAKTMEETLKTMNNLPFDP